MENDEKDPNQDKYSQEDNKFKRDQANGNLGDPSAKRNIGPNGITERKNQKDDLDNLHIAGNEVTGYGANDRVNAGENAQGPGFEAEGSEYIANQPNLNSTAASGPIEESQQSSEIKKPDPDNS